MVLIESNCLAPFIAHVNKRVSFDYPMQLYVFIYSQIIVTVNNVMKFDQYSEDVLVYLLTYKMILSN